MRVGFILNGNVMIPIHIQPNNINIIPQHSNINDSINTINNTSFNNNINYYNQSLSVPHNNSIYNSVGQLPLLHIIPSKNPSYKSVSSINHSNDATYNDKRNNNDNNVNIGNIINYGNNNCNAGMSGNGVTYSKGNQDRSWYSNEEEYIVKLLKEHKKTKEIINLFRIKFPKRQEIRSNAAISRKIKKIRDNITTQNLINITPNIRSKYASKLWDKDEITYLNDMITNGINKKDGWLKYIKLFGDRGRSQSAFEMKLSRQIDKINKNKEIKYINLPPKKKRKININY